MTEVLYRLNASGVIKSIRKSEATVEQYAQSLLDRIAERDSTVKAWTYFDPEYVLQQARLMDKIPVESRGPLHGVAIGVKDTIYTRDMPTEHNSLIYQGSFPIVDASVITTLRHAGALIFGKTTTVELAAVFNGTKTTNPHNSVHTPGGSSSGSAAAVADFQVPISLGSQTVGSIIRPGSFTGVYAYKPTWASISREGIKIHSLILDTAGFFSRSISDLQLLADVFHLEDDQPPIRSVDLKNATFALCRTPVWEHAGPGTVRTMDIAGKLLKEAGATVEDIDLPQEFNDGAEMAHQINIADGRVSYLGEYYVAKEKLDPSLAAQVKNTSKMSRKQQLVAFDKIATLRPKIDEIAGKYTAIVCPSVVDEAPEGLHSTGNGIFNIMWTALHVPIVGLPGFAGNSGMPISVSLIAPRYHDRHLLNVSESVAPIFAAGGGWMSTL